MLATPHSNFFFPVFVEIQLKRSKNMGSFGYFHKTKHLFGAFPHCAIKDSSYSQNTKYLSFVKLVASFEKCDNVLNEFGWFVCSKVPDYYFLSKHFAKVLHVLNTL